MGKILGYLIAVLGLVAIVLSFNSYIKEFFIGLNVKIAYLMILGIILVIFGIVLSLNKKQAKQDEEVPIFEGEGKKRRIVGYRKTRTH
ncbi:MAG: hypothetical protein NT076_00195 [Candidatus Pacearchaeota archaeon]|nr:hypothetical protein [Candidatus Pacearchaeota archaeon]